MVGALAADDLSCSKGSIRHLEVKWPPHLCPPCQDGNAKGAGQMTVGIPMDVLSRRLFKGLDHTHILADASLKHDGRHDFLSLSHIVEILSLIHI